MTLRDPSAFEAEGRGAQSAWLTVEDVDDDGRVRVGVAAFRGGPERSIELTMVQTAALAEWLSRPAVRPLVRAAAKAAYEGMPDGPIRDELLAAVDVALGPGS